MTLTKIILKNVKCVSCFWKCNSEFPHFYILFFQRSTEIWIRGIRVICTEFIILQSILKSSINMNSYRLKQSNVSIAFGFLTRR